VASVALAGTWAEVGDAPPLLPGQQTAGSGSLDLITGSFVGATDVDLYEIKVVDFTSFSATTVGLTTSDTRLYLFDRYGFGVTYDDDAAGTWQSTLTSQFLTANGTYYLAVTRYNVIASNGGSGSAAYIWWPNPGNVERAPDGDAAFSPLGGWLGASFAGDNTYGVSLTGVDFSLAPVSGACCVGPACTPNATQTECEQALGGVYQGDNTDCFPNPCTPIDYYLDARTAEQGGTGWNGGQWIGYSNGWLNQWWPNEFALNRQKQVTLSFWIGYADAPPTVAVNYSSREWPDPQSPPMPVDDAYVIRVPLGNFGPGYYTFTVLLPFCPAWVSVDVMENGGFFSIEGTIAHVCLPLPTGACCVGDVCTANVTQTECEQVLGGVYKGDGSTCVPNPCPPPTGACCVGMVCTDNVAEADCVAQPGGVYKGAGSVCNPVPTACYGDADCSGAVNFDDINYFVAALASGEPGWSGYYQSKHGGTPPPCTFWNCDANGSGRCADPQAPEVNFDDINPFVAELVTPPSCP
jgi:hypothetical protein